MNPQKTEYIIYVNLNPEKVFPALGKISKYLNNAMKDFGFHENVKFMCESIPVLKLSSSRPLTESEKNDLKKYACATIAKSDLSKKFDAEFEKIEEIMVF